MQKFNKIVWHAVKGADVPMPKPKTELRSDASPQSASAVDNEEETDSETSSDGDNVDFPFRGQCSRSAFAGTTPGRSMTSRSPILTSSKTCGYS